MTGLLMGFSRMLAKSDGCYATGEKCKNESHVIVFENYHKHRTVAIFPGHLIVKTVRIYDLEQVIGQDILGQSCLELAVTEANTIACKSTCPP